MLSRNQTTDDATLLPDILSFFPTFTNIPNVSDAGVGQRKKSMNYKYFGSIGSKALILKTLDEDLTNTSVLY
jgi:hypothetical protein